MCSEVLQMLRCKVTTLCKKMASRVFFQNYTFYSINYRELQKRDAEHSPSLGVSAFLAHMREQVEFLHIQWSVVVFSELCKIGRNLLKLKLQFCDNAVNIHQLQVLAYIRRGTSLHASWPYDCSGALETKPDASARTESSWSPLRTLPLMNHVGKPSRPVTAHSAAIFFPLPAPLGKHST